MRRQRLCAVTKKDSSNWIQKLYSLAFALIAISSQSSFAQESRAISELVREGQYELAEKKILQTIEGIPSQEEARLVEKSDLYFSLGRTRYLLGKYPEAEKDLKLALDLRGNFQDYIHHYLGLVFVKKAEIKLAKSHFQAVMDYKPRSRLRIDSAIELAQIAVSEKEWNKARGFYRYLERNKRRDEDYPAILSSLVEVELHRNNLWQSCRWVRKLYRSYPLSAQTEGWNPKLDKQTFGKFQPKCQASQNDKKSRIKKLLWSGKIEQAREEIEILRKDGVDPYSVDVLLVDYYNHKGEISNSLEILKKYYDKKQWNVDYLSMLAFTSAKIGSFPQAVGLYYKVYKLQGRSSQAKKSLYRAAFLSYQFQDYDGAARKFEEFTTKYSRTSLARDAKWHLAWIRYLKGDYEGSYAKLKDIWKKRRYYRRSKSISDDKITYWIAMSLYRMGRVEEAKQEFMKLASESHFSFYTLSARSRVLDLMGTKAIRSISSLDYDNFASSIAQLEDVDEAAASEVPAGGEEDEMSVLNDTENAEENLEQEEELQAKKEEAEEAQKEKETTELQSVFHRKGAFGVVSSKKPDPKPNLVPEEEVTEVTNFKNPLMNQRFRRATSLIQLGMYDLARWELYDIEKRTTNREYLKTLMEAYQKIGAYHRSSYIGEVFFAKDRAKYGIRGARYLWDYTYPQAYSTLVERLSTDKGVPSEFTWGIMRQESNFREDISSPVGARGLMQLMPYTAKKVADIYGAKYQEIRDLYSPEINVELGTSYLNRLMKKFGNKFPLIAAAYNAGPHRVDAWLQTFGHLDMDEFVEHIPYVETRNYVKKVTQNFHVYELLRNQSSFELDLAALSKPVGLTYVGKLPTKENWN